MSAVRTPDGGEKSYLQILFLILVIHCDNEFLDLLPGSLNQFVDQFRGLFVILGQDAGQNQRKVHAADHSGLCQKSRLQEYIRCC